MFKFKLTPEQNEYGRVKEAERLINKAVELMTTEQLSQWDGVRAWLEAPTRHAL